MFRNIVYCTSIFILISCGPTPKTVSILRIKGSETLHETFAELKRDFESKQDTVKIDLQGGGSRIGLMSIVQGEADLGLSSFEFNLDTISSNYVRIEQKVIAFDGLVMIANKLNPLESLHTQQIADIYNGQYSDWSQLSGNGGKIEPVMRNSNSGTQQFFAGYFELDQITDGVKVAIDNPEIVRFVAEKPNAIGFIGFAYFTELVKNLKVPDENSAFGFVDPSPENLMNGRYPLKRNLLVYYQSNPDPKLKAFLVYLDSSRAKSIIQSTGLMPF